MGDDGVTVVEQVVQAPERDYLKQLDRLMIAPMVPVLGNAQIRRSEKVMLRFFDGLRCFEADLFFQRVVTFEDEVAIQLTFPTSITELRKRTFSRVHILPDLPIRVTLSNGSGAQVTPRLLDISPGGLGFCVAEEGSGFHVEDVVKAVIALDDYEKVEVACHVRSRNQGSADKECLKRDKVRVRYGVQFDVVNLHMETRIQNLVNTIQRLYAQERNHTYGRVVEEGPALSSRETVLAEFKKVKFRFGQR